MLLNASLAPAVYNLESIDHSCIRQGIMVLALAIHTVSNCSAKVCIAPHERGWFCRQGPYSAGSKASYSNDTLDVHSAHTVQHYAPSDTYTFDCCDRCHSR